MAGFFAQELIAEAAILAIFALSLDLAGDLRADFLRPCRPARRRLLCVRRPDGARGRQPQPRLSGRDRGGRGCVAFLVGLFAVRTTGAFFIMVTLAAAEMLYAWGFRSKTFDGANGMGGVPRLDLTAIGIDLNDPGDLCADA